jgi:hypothetical protein
VALHHPLLKLRQLGLEQTREVTRDLVQLLFQLTDLLVLLLNHFFLRQLQLLDLRFELPLHVLLALDPFLLGSDCLEKAALHFPVSVGHTLDHLLGLDLFSGHVLVHRFFQRLDFLLFC